MRGCRPPLIIDTLIIVGDPGGLRHGRPDAVSRVHALPARGHEPRRALGHPPQGPGDPSAVRALVRRLRRVRPRGVVRSQDAQSHPSQTAEQGPQSHPQPHQPLFLATQQGVEPGLQRRPQRLQPQQVEVALFPGVPRL